MKKIHIYYLNKIKETLAKEYAEQDSEEPDKRKIYIYERTLRHWIDKAQLSDDEWTDLLTLVDWQNNDCVSVLKANGWEILTGEVKICPYRNAIVEKVVTPHSIVHAISDVGIVIREAEEN